MDALLARVRVALRHAARPAAGIGPIVRVGDVEVDMDRRRVTVNGAEVHLTPTEWDLVKLFVSHPDKVLTDRMITGAVWGASFAEQAHSLHVYIARLRKKLEPAGTSRRHISTEPGVGYRFVSDAIERNK
ncbi:MAG: response regulator transcription factor [Chloroflexi bacterium]|nr:response regulator transcription factor [Chloroflexota bacterium]